MIDSDLKKYDTGLSEKLNGEYGSVGERGEEAEI